MLVFPFPGSFLEVILTRKHSSGVQTARLLTVLLIMNTLEHLQMTVVKWCLYSKGSLYGEVPCIMGNVHMESVCGQKDRHS